MSWLTQLLLYLTLFHVINVHFILEIGIENRKQQVWERLQLCNCETSRVLFFLSISWSHVKFDYNQFTGSLPLRCPALVLCIVFYLNNRTRTIWQCAYFAKYINLSVSVDEAVTISLNMSLAKILSINKSTSRAWFVVTSTFLLLLDGKNLRWFT